LQFDWLGSCPWPSAQISVLNCLLLFLLHFKSGAVVQKSIQINPNDILGIGFQEEVDVEALRGRLRKMSDANFCVLEKLPDLCAALEQTSESRRESVL